MDLRPAGNGFLEIRPSKALRKETNKRLNSKELMPFPTLIRSVFVAKSRIKDCHNTVDLAKSGYA
jgi:hypothetical protein